MTARQRGSESEWKWEWERVREGPSLESRVWSLEASWEPAPRTPRPGEGLARHVHTSQIPVVELSSLLAHRSSSSSLAPQASSPCFCLNSRISTLVARPDPSSRPSSGPQWS